MRSKEINLLGGSNADSNVAWSTEDTVNYFVERASSDGFLTPLELRDAPGLKPYVAGPATGEIPAGPVRGSHDCEGKQFHVMGSKLYQITNNGVAIPLGTVPGTQRVNMAHNQIVGGNEVIITTGTPNGYVYNTVTQVFARITDPGYPGGGSVDYMDTYLLSVEPYGRYWYWSDQASATSYNTLNRTEAEADPDSIVALAVNAFEVVIFGQQTVEFFYNAGGINGNTFKSKRVMNGHGCAARDSVVKLDNTLFWLGVDGILYRLNGYQAQPISSPQFTQRIQGKNWAKAYAYSFEDRGHVAYIITFPDGETFVYDVPTQATTRLESYGLTRWRASTLIKTGGKWIAGDFQAGKLYELDWAYPMEGEGTPMVRERITGNTFNAHNKIEIPLLELLFQTGTPEVEPVMFVEQPEPPTIAGAAPDGTFNAAYPGFAYTLGGGSGTYAVTLRSGTLPPNVTLSTSGVLSTAITTTVGSYPITIRNTDSVTGLYADLDDAIVVTVAPGIMMAQTIDSTNLVSTDGGLTFALTANYAQPGNRDLKALPAGRFIANLRYTDDLGATAWEVATAAGSKNYEMTCRGSNVVWGANGPFEKPQISSDDGVTAIDGGASGNGVYSVVYSGDTRPLLGVGNGTDFMVSSDDGATFTATGVAHGLNGNNTSHASCKYSGGAVFAGSNAGITQLRVVFTEDGTSFAGGDITGLGSTSTNTGKDPSRLCAGEVAGIETIVLLGNATGELFWTQDEGTTWHLVTAPLGAGVTLDAIAWNGMRFVLCGHIGTTGVMKYGTDLVTWTNCTFPANQGYYAIASQPPTGEI